MKQKHTHNFSRSSHCPGHPTTSWLCSKRTEGPALPTPEWRTPTRPRVSYSTILASGLYITMRCPSVASCIVCNRLPREVDSRQGLADCGTRVMFLRGGVKFASCKEKALRHRHRQWKGMKLFASQPPGTSANKPPSISRIKPQIMPANLGATTHHSHALGLKQDAGTISRRGAEPLGPR